jgi:putative endonuclease
MNTRAKGDIGENIACDFLIRQGFTILNRNYRKIFGEIDIVARENGSRENMILHFFEVKSIYCLFDHKGPVYGHRPEENVTRLKYKRVGRAIECYLNQYFRNIYGTADVPFQFHVLSVYIDKYSNENRVEWFRNIVL